MIVDRTDLDSLIDVQLEFDHSLTASSADNSVPVDLKTPLTTAIQDIGLKLVPGKALREVLVIDSVQRPSEN